jgi:O-antigen ligase
MSLFIDKLHQIFEKKGVIALSKPSSLDVLTLTCLALFPLLYMTLRSWTNSFLLILFGFAIIYLVSNPAAIRSGLSGKSSKWIFFTLSSAILAILISQAFRQEFSATAYDGPSRMFFAAIIFLYLKNRKINFTKILEWVLPISLMICLGAYFLNPAASVFWSNRAATYFVDTITFGTYCLILGFICLIGIRINQGKESTLLTCLKILGFLIACYLAIKSQSRSAWTTAIVLIFFSTFTRFEKRSFIPWGLMILSSIAVTIIYFYSPEVHQRVQDGIHEVITYFNQRNFDTSLGLRISMIRVAFNLIIENPLAGLKDGVMPALSTIKSIQPFYTDLLQSMITNTGTHTEILAQGVRSGIWGLFSGTALFLAPGLVFYKRLSSSNDSVRSAAIIGMTLVLGLFIASLTIQVFNLKYTSSFYALMIAGLAAQALQNE